MKSAIIILLAAATLAPAALAHDPAPAAKSPFTEQQRGFYGAIGKILVAAAERMPEEKLAYRPTAEVRTFGEILGHAAASQYYFCAAVRGETSPAPKLDATTASRKELIAALQAAFTYCDATYGTLSDTAGAVPMKFMGDEMPKLSVLGVNNMHLMEHYGNLITYMRMNGIVPPTSDPEFMKTIQ